MFEKASRQKIRFNTARGMLTTEQLWDLPLKELDGIAVERHKALKEMPEVSFISSKKNTGRERLELEFEIVKHIINVKMTELAEREAAAARAASVAEEREILKDAIAKKKAAAIGDLSLEEMEKRLAAVS